MRLWCDSTRRLESNVSSRDVFQLANAGTDFVVLDFQRARRLHASFLLRIGDKVFSDFNRYRQAVLGARNLKNRLLLPMSSAHVMLGENAPVALTRACESAFGAANDRYFLPFSVAAGVIGWHEHYRRGIDVCNWRVRPAYGVFAPTRTLYCEMIERGLKKRGRLALDVGTGSGVLALILSRSFDRVIGTDLLEAAVTCARENVRLNGVKNVEIVRADLFPEV
jgi:hypothetical protein